MSKDENGGRFPIQRVNCENAENFLNLYAVDKKPLIISGVIDQWQAFGKWSLDYFENAFAELKFYPALNLPSAGAPFEKVWRDHQQSMTLKEFIRYMKTADKPCYIHRQLIEKFPGAGNDVSFDNILPKDDYEAESFMWVGSSGTRTGLHFDFQDTLLCQFYGTKKICLVSPDESKYLYPYKDSITKSRVVPEEPDLEQYPDFAMASVYEGSLGPGEMLFIPKRWWHSVVSVEPSISLSHNYGKKISAMELIQAIHAGGLLHWITVSKDFLWHGVFDRTYKTRLFDDPPFGKLLYDMFASAIKRRLYT